MKTYLPKDHLNQRQWYVIDAEGAVLGRLAAKVANLLRGKQKPIFTPHLDTGDFVVVINADKVRLTGKKEANKDYMTYSGWRGGEKHQSASQVRSKHPEWLIQRAVKGMMPKNRLGRHMLGKLKVYQGSQHPHQAQQPETISAN